MNEPTPELTARPSRETLETTPVFPLSTVLFPGGPLHLRIFEPRYLDMVSDRLRRDAPFIVALILTGREAGGSATTHRTGTLARIVDWNRREDGLLGITSLGGRRVCVLDTSIRPDNLCVATARMLEEEPASTIPGEFRKLENLLRRLLEQFESLYSHVTPRYDDASWVGYRLSELLPIPLPRKQQMLEMDDPVERLDQLDGIIASLAAKSGE